MLDYDESMNTFPIRPSYIPNNKAIITFTQLHYNVIIITDILSNYLAIICSIFRCFETSKKRLKLFFSLIHSLFQHETNSINCGCKTRDIIDFILFVSNEIYNFNSLFDILQLRAIDCVK